MRFFLLLMLCVLTAHGEVAVLRPLHATADKELQELATAVRAIAQVFDARFEGQDKGIHVEGTPEQLELATWLFSELDQSMSPALRAQKIATPAAFDLKEAPRGETAVRILYVPNASTLQEFHELATAMRTTVEVRMVYAYAASNAVVIRGTREQVQAAEWLLRTLDSGAPSSASFPYGGGEIRVLRIENAPTIQEFQERATLLRTIVGLRYVFTVNRTRLVTVRGPAAHLNLAEALNAELGRPGPRSLPALTHPDGPESVIRVFYTSPDRSLEDFQQLAEEVRQKAELRYLFTWRAPRVLVARGTAEQMGRAEQVLGKP